MNKLLPSGFRFSRKQAIIGSCSCWNHSPRTSLAPPFLRWVGGKTRLLPILRAALPKGYRLIEPFVGSGAVFLGTRYERYLLNDANPDLINLFGWLQRDCERFLRFARPLFLCEHPDEDVYARTRSAFNDAGPGSLERAILFLWLNKTCFNGICRYNGKGEFNVPRGDDKGPLVLPEREIRAFHRKAQIAMFTAGDFETAIAKARDGDVVYCDPPYVPRSATASFTKYAQNDFGEAQHIALAEACRAAAARGALVVLSNSDTPLTREIYAGGLLVSAKLPHLVGAHSLSRQETSEALMLFGDRSGLDFWSMSKRLFKPEPEQKNNDTHTTHDVIATHYMIAMTP